MNSVFIINIFALNGQIWMLSTINLDLWAEPALLT